jgi:hypothetical protein
LGAVQVIGMCRPQMRDERTRTIDVPLQYLPQRQRISFRKASSCLFDNGFLSPSTNRSTVGMNLISGTY